MKCLLGSSSDNKYYMGKRKIKPGGGLASIKYSFNMAKEAGGVKKLYSALKSSNTCKPCALGMGGKTGGMRNEIGETFQVCKKSIQAQARDMQHGIDRKFFEENSIDDLSKLTGRELEALGRLSQPLFLSEDGTHFQVLQWHEALEKLLQY